MESHFFSEFERILTNSKNQVGSSVLLILSWIAASDGNIDSHEHLRLVELSDGSGHDVDIDVIISAVKRYDIDAFVLASEILQKAFRGNRASLFLELAVGVALADSYLKPSENHILRYLADLLGVGERGLNQIFQEITGRPIPWPSDPSRASFWAGKGRSDRTHKGSAGRNSVSSTWAYAALGIEPGASQVEIRTAFRRLAQVHHPDRYNELGPEAVAAATESFQRINAAYRALKDA